jgi:DnaJ-domain-containing protein 1
MTPKSDLEIKGSFFTHPFAELLAEISAARLNGSLRVSDKDRKCVIYFKSGLVVFAVSNARSARLFDILLRRNKLSKQDLSRIPRFANDLELCAFLQDKNFLTKFDADRIFTEQIEGILVDILSWDAGEWSFSSLARIRDGLAFQVNATQMLVDYSRCLGVESILERFRSLNEKFSRSEMPATRFELTPDEAFTLSRADDGDLTAEALVAIAAMPENKVLKVIYTLWLGGLLERHDWQPAFSAGTITFMKNAKLALKQEARFVPAAAAATNSSTAAEPIQPEPDIAWPAISLDEYLDRVENAETHYDILGVDVKADTDELKRAYFALARMFHPDRYHAEGGVTFSRVQQAFSQLAQAHETLKNPETREIYDYRMRKELAEREKLRTAGNNGERNLQIEQASENFERGFTLLMDNSADDAIPFLARAAHLAPNNARYRAYYGKALASDPKQRHKAESELQAALKIDPNNATFRILLAEFFISVNLLKRAEGELNRLLAIFPSNREARELLASLPK